MKCSGNEHCDDGILKPVIMDLEPGDLHHLSTGELCALDFDMHAMMTKNQAQDFIVKLQALIKEL